MAAMLAQARARTRARSKEQTQAGPIVVITGGLHTPALLATRDLPAGKPPPSPAAGSSARQAGSAYLIRYGFRQLDRLSGYAAGMPSPGFYDQLWQTRGEPDAGCRRPGG